MCKVLLTHAINGVSLLKSSQLRPGTLKDSTGKPLRFQPVLVPAGASKSALPNIQNQKEYRIEYNMIQFY